MPPPATSQVNPAAVSAADGSVAVPVNVTDWPTSAVAEDGARLVTVGGTLVTFRSKTVLASFPSSSVAVTATC